MKNLITLLLSVIVSISQAQLIVDSVSTGPAYATQSFYSLKNGEITNIPNRNWDIAFSLTGTGAAASGILLNELNAQLWAVPQDTSFWAAFDTSGYKNWRTLYNSDTTWTNGAYNKHRETLTNGTFDMGWGNLDPANNFWTIGDSLYLCKLTNGSFKKVWIESLKQGVWQFRYANIDGTNDTTISIDKADYTNKNFIYFSLENNTIIDREPANDSWDLTFVGHKDELFPGFSLSMVSVFCNKNIWTAKTHSASYAEAILTTQAETEYTQNISNIGREWKNFTGGVWYLYDTISYFVYDQDSSLYRMVFTEFGGGANGTSYFNKEKMLTTNIRNIENNVSFALYPNPSSEILNVIIALEKTENVNFKIYDIKGQLMVDFDKNNINNLEVIELNVSDFSNGMYYMVVSGNSFHTTQQFIKK